MSLYFRYERIVSGYALEGIFHYAIYQTFGFLTVLFWACVPVTFVLNGDERRLPLDGWYPYDTTESFAFIMTWAHQVQFPLHFFVLYYYAAFHHLKPNNYQFIGFLLFQYTFYIYIFKT